MKGSTSRQPAVPGPLPWVSAAHARSEFLRLRNVVDALVRIAEHAGDTTSFLNEAADTAMQLTRATGAVVLMADKTMALSIAAARGQMAGVDGAAFDMDRRLHARPCGRTRPCTATPPIATTGSKAPSVPGTRCIR